MRGLVSFMVFGAAALALLTSCEELGRLANRDPVIRSITADPDTVAAGGTVFLSVDAYDPDNNEFSVKWSSNFGTFLNSTGTTVRWTAPQREGLFEIEVTVTDVNKGSATDVVRIAVISQNVPYVRITEPSDGAVVPGVGTLRIIASVSPATFIDKVAFYINDVEEYIDRHEPFIYDLDLAGRSGIVKIRCVAYRIGEGNIRGSDEIVINVEQVVPIPLE